MASTELRAEDIRWDLTDLCSSAEEARDAVVRRSSSAHRSSPAATAAQIASLDPTAFRALLDETDELEQDLSRLQVYSYLRLSMAATEVEANDLATFSRDRGAEIENALVFLGLEWIALDDDKADEILASPELAPVRAQAAGRARGEAVRSERARGAGAERAPPDGLGLAGAARPARLDARGAVRRGRGRAAAHDQPAPLVSLPAGPRHPPRAPSPRCTMGSSRAWTCSRPRTTRSSATGSAPTACAATRIRCSRRTCRTSSTTRRSRR